MWGDIAINKMLKTAAPVELTSSRETDNDETTNKTYCGGFSGGAVLESLPANAGDTGSSPGLGGSHMPRSS